jgi:methylmalonyl-CoA/ethylmalonyl-CoA epimerase
MIRIEHIGIAVENMKESIELYEQLLNTPCYKRESVASESVETAFFKVGESKIELLEASDPNSAIAKFIAKKGQGIHHIAYEVENIQAEMKPWDLKYSTKNPNAVPIIN